MARRWVFKRHLDPLTLWTWRLLGADGDVVKEAGDFENYGAALQDAAQNGFRPTEDDWVVENAHEVTHHEHGQKPLVVLKQDPTTIPPGTVFAAPPGNDSAEQYSTPATGGAHPETQ
jgi:hypothetical protein